MKKIKVPTSDFNIADLSEINHANVLCENCYSMMFIEDWEYEDEIHCPICSVKYTNPDGIMLLDHFKAKDLTTSFESKSDFFDHCQDLARIGMSIQSENLSPMAGLLMLLASAKKFVHFTTYKISHVFIGSLKTVAQKIPVRGIVSGMDQNSTLEELTTYQRDAYGLNVKVFQRDNSKVIPHQKIIIIDGLLAIKGSTNLTLNGWRNAEQGLDMIEVATNLREVTELNNRYFSPVWASTSNTKEVSISEYPF